MAEHAGNVAAGNQHGLFLVGQALTSGKETDEGG